MARNKGDSDSQLERLTPIWKDLVNGVRYVGVITEQLKLTGTLGQKEVEQILHKDKTPPECKIELLNAIERKGAYDIFSHCLRVSGQDELYQLMVDKVQVQPVTDELTTLQYRVFCLHRIGDPRKLQVPPHLSDRLEKQREALQGMTNVERLVDLIEDEGCLTAEITRTIKEQPDSKEKASMLVDCVKKSTLYSFLVLARFLDISQQKELMSEISEQDTKTALGRMDDLLLNVYCNLLGAIALKQSTLEERLGLKVRDFVPLTIHTENLACLCCKGIELTELFNDHEKNKPTRSVLVGGAPGIGKSTAAMQIAREATKKRMSNVPRPPFVIQLRSVDWTTDTSLKRLLLRHGPVLAKAEHADVWRALSGKETEITIILDGADQVPNGFFMNNPGPVTGADMIAPPKDILNNLISGKLLAGAHVLVSSRYFGLAKDRDHFHRKVEVVGFDEKGLNIFLTKELPSQHRNEVLEFLDKQFNIRSFLLTPLHAASFVVCAESIQNTSDLLIQSRTQLALSLIDSLLKTKLKKVTKVMRQKDLDKQGNTVWKLCKLIAELLLNEGAIKIEMTEKDLEKAEVTDEECVETGLFIKRDIVEGNDCRSIFVVPHKSLLESMAAIGLAESQIKKLVAENDGRYDLIITYVAGIMAGEGNRKTLNYILSKEDKKDFRKLTQDVVSGVLGSKRRMLYDGEGFCMRIVNESQQWNFIGDLKRIMNIPWISSDSRELLMTADQLLQHDPGNETKDPIIRGSVCGLHNMKYCPRASYLFLCHCGDGLMAADIAVNAEHLLNISSIKFYQAGITRESFAGFTTELSLLHNLEAVSFVGNKVGSSSSSDESSVRGFSSLISSFQLRRLPHWSQVSVTMTSVLGCLSSILSLKYLELPNCDLSDADVNTVTSSCPRLRHLNITGNLGVRGGGVSSRELTGLIVGSCKLRVNELVKAAVNNGETLQFLGALADNNVFNSTSSYHINVLLDHCPHLVELYVYNGGELVDALSKRRAACLKHLWLSFCDLSSSWLFGSLYHDVNISMLSDVIKRHQSITSLTLVQCHPFTSNIMHLLSSSMTSITSLFISPQRPHPHPPDSSDVASLIRASPGLTQIWLGGVHDEWSTSDYIAVINAVNASTALQVVGLDVLGLSPNDLRGIVRRLKRPLNRLYLLVDSDKRLTYAEVVLEGELGVIQIKRAYDLYVDYDLYVIYHLYSGLFYQHLPPSIPYYFRRLF